MLFCSLIGEREWKKLFLTDIVEDNIEDIKLLLILGLWLTDWSSYESDERSDAKFNG